MHCNYCNQPAGFLKASHPECEQRIESVDRKIHKILEEGISSETVPSSLQQALVDSVREDSFYYNYLTANISHDMVYPGETVLYHKYPIRISESKNWKRMVSTGHRYEKKPEWTVGPKVLDQFGTVVITDKAVYLGVAMTTIRYTFKQIVNYAHNAESMGGYAYFDVKTTSQYPHKFIMSSEMPNERYNIEKDISMLIYCMKS